MSNESVNDAKQFPRELAGDFLSAYTRKPVLALGRLAYWLTIAARSDYVESGAAPDLASVRLRAHNELLIVIAKQIRRAGGESEVGYPEQDLLQILWETPGASLTSLTWALQQIVDAAANEDMPRRSQDLET